MLSPTNQAVRFYAFYTSAKVGKAGLTPTVDVYRGTPQIVTGGAATEIGGGLYTYQLAAGSTATAQGYAAVFKTADTSVDQQHVASLWLVGEGQAAGLSAAAASTGGMLTRGTGAGQVEPDGTGKVTTANPATNLAVTVTEGG
jgi:hypothetical protein